MEEPCIEPRREVEAALAEWERILDDSGEASTPADPVGKTTPTMGGDLGTRFYENISQREAASRRYRAAVRSLAECRRQHELRAGLTGSAHS